MEFEFGHYKLWALGIIIVLITLEIIWSWRTDAKVYNAKESLANFAILIGFNLSKFLFAGYQLGIMKFVQQFALFKISSTIYTFIIVFILADFIYYWYHRISHIWQPMWAFHVVHHSGMYMNLTTSYRLNWFSALISPLFFVPLVLIGFQPEIVVVSYALNLLYQFLMHTESINKLGAIEGIIDTPSAHRVHHGSNPIYIDKNFGGVLMIWDRIFNTYQPETEKPIYGTTKGFISNNPFVLIFHGFIDLFKGKMKYRG
jgi:sterol desaturase/sphingolipid hydroxylase (fatty acid hydroxylase superfamily)